VEAPRRTESIQRSQSPKHASSKHPATKFALRIAGAASSCHANSMNYSTKRRILNAPRTSNQPEKFSAMISEAGMSQILKFPDSIRRRSNDGPPREAAYGKNRTVTKMPSPRVPVMTGDQQLRSSGRLQYFVADRNRRRPTGHRLERLDSYRDSYHAGFVGSTISNASIRQRPWSGRFGRIPDCAQAA